MRVLILGGTGMLGHKVLQACEEECDTWITLRSSWAASPGRELFHADRMIEGVDAAEFETVHGALLSTRPDVVVNCVGLVKQIAEGKYPIAVLRINALLPQLLAKSCQEIGARLIHVSTDCVFSGRRLSPRQGMYSERDIPDAEDLYGRAKVLGEVDGAGCLTLRTSFIGRELSRGTGLLEWLLSQPQRATVPGYTHAIYSGFTSGALAAIIREIVVKHPSLCGIYHVASTPISKYRLLCLLQQRLRLSVSVMPSDQVRIDRSLDSSKFIAATGMLPPSWEEMVEGLVTDRTPYESWRHRWAS